MDFLDDVNTTMAKPLNLICIAIGAMPAPLPVGLIEAKPETADPLSGMEQGKGYGDCRRFSIHYILPPTATVTASSTRSAASRLARMTSISSLPTPSWSSAMPATPAST
ncbi:MULTISPECIES: hypothetical protein [unclassified Thiocapsa]|uniref:hypothetical protein n=1 Tax=unclassified Thiocapsa TaxID=2641286 RepID=UPI0035B1AD8B